MATHAVRKTCREGHSFAAVEVDSLCHVLATAVPRGGVTLREQVRDALRQVAGAVREGGPTGRSSARRCSWPTRA